MSDLVLKELLREERRRKSEKNKDKPRERSRDKKDKPRERSEKPERADRSEKPERADRTKRRSHRNKEGKREARVENKEKFMFLYEDFEGDLHLDLKKVESDTCKIFPVYFTGWNQNLTEESITKVDGKWTSEYEERSWLTVIFSEDKNVSVEPFDMEDVAVYNGKFFHCQDDLIDYIKENGCDYLDITR